MHRGVSLRVWVIAGLVLLAGVEAAAAQSRVHTVSTFLISPQQEKTLPEPLFQITIDCTDLKKSNKTVMRLYEEYRRVTRAAVRMELEEFIHGLVRNVQGAVNGRAHGFVPFSIRYKGGCERIFMEVPSAEPVEVTPIPMTSAPA